MDWFAVQCDGSNKQTIVNFRDLLESTRFKDGLPNTGQESTFVEAIGDSLPSAVETAKNHMLQLRQSRRHQLEERVLEDRTRFELWYNRSKEKVKVYVEKRRRDTGRVPKDVVDRARKMEKVIEDRKEFRRKWFEDSLTVVDTPYLKLAAVFAGE